MPGTLLVTVNILEVIWSLSNSDLSNLKVSTLSKKQIIMKNSQFDISGQDFL